MSTARLVKSIVILLASMLWTIAILSTLGLIKAHARDLNGQWAGSPLKAWFDSLQSSRGMCCSFADGISLKDVEWDTKLEKDGKIHYRVFMCAKDPVAPSVQTAFMDCTKKDWVVVPDIAVVTVPNKYGRAVVWPYFDAVGATQIRCFMPGSMT
jgi:hypothetical protein